MHKSLKVKYVTFKDIWWFVLYFKKQKVILGTFAKEWLWGVLFPVRLSVEKKKKCAAEEGTDANESGSRLCRVHRVFSFLIQYELLLSFHAFNRESFGLSACVSAKWASWVSLAVAIADEHRSRSLSLSLSVFVTSERKPRTWDKVVVCASCCGRTFPAVWWGCRFCCLSLLGRGTREGFPRGRSCSCCPRGGTVVLFLHELQFKSAPRELNTNLPSNNFKQRVLSGLTN